MKNTNALDLDKLTLGEVAMIEDLSGQALASIGEDDKPMGKMLAALAMIAKRRSGFPTFKWGDALALTMDEAMEVLGMAEDDEDDADEPVDQAAIDEALMAEKMAEKEEKRRPTAPAKKESPTTT